MQTRRQIRTIAVHFDALAEARRFVASQALDFGCRPHAVRKSDGTVFTPALVTDAELARLRAEGHRVELLFDQVSDDRSASSTIGRGDRFEGGKRAPQGVGSRGERGADAVGPIMNADEIGTAVAGLANEYGIETFDVPDATAEGAGGKGGKVGPADPGAYHVYFTAGVHARERGGPDALVYFVADLLYAQKHGTGLVYGARSYTHADVLKALNTGIVFFPLVNPDGVRFDQKTDALWRKNRNPANAKAGDPATVGVDINRNYDFLWDFRRCFHPAVHASSLASDQPALETFHGPHPFSEPETRNVAWVFDRFPRVRWYMDIHSAAGQVLYSWGDDDNQFGDPTMQFGNPAWDGKRGLLGDGTYREWIEERDFGKVLVAARRVARAMHAVGGRSYVEKQAVDLFPTSGASDDYAFSRHRADGRLNKVHGFTLEFGYPTNFYPTLAEYHANLQDVGAGLMEFCLAAADAGVV